MATRRPNRRPEPGAAAPEWVWVGAAGLLVLAGVLPWAAAATAGVETGLNPFTFTARLFAGQEQWPGGATVLLVGLLALLVAAGAGVPLWLRHRQGHRYSSWVDRKAPVLATARELKPLGPKAARADTRRLQAEKACTGVRLADAVRPGVGRLYASWEWVQLWIMGPRAGKTSCVVVPQICATAGPVFATSNKRDVVDLARPVRERIGRAWIFDLQQIIGEPADWWWNPLDYVTGVAKAVKLARLFSAAVSAADKGDAYFEPEGEALLSQYLLAAACGGEDITAVARWLHNKNDTTPVDHLTAAGEHPTAGALTATMRMAGTAGEQSEGIYGTARKMVRFLADRSVLSWITPHGAADRRPRFDPHAFATSTDTVFAISKEGAGTARALTAALTVAVAEAAEEAAEQTVATDGTRPGRLCPPLLMALDEVANICRWPDLPDLYSHYGSKGIVICSFLQSYSQGEDVWGRAGMKKLWSAANIRGIGAGIAEADFLKDVSELIGDHDVRARTVSSGRGQGASVSSHLRRDRILDVSELAALPTGRAVLFASGIPAALTRLVHYSDGPWADVIGGQPTAARNPLLTTTAASPRTPAPVTPVRASSEPVWGQTATGEHHDSGDAIDTYLTEGRWS